MSFSNSKWLEITFDLFLNSYLIENPPGWEEGQGQEGQVRRQGASQGWSRCWGRLKLCMTRVMTSVLLWPPVVLWSHLAYSRGDLEQWGPSGGRRGWGGWSARGGRWGQGPSRRPAPCSRCRQVAAPWMTCFWTFASQGFKRLEQVALVVASWPRYGTGDQVVTAPALKTCCSSWCPVLPVSVGPRMLLPQSNLKPLMDSFQTLFFEGSLVASHGGHQCIFPHRR